jgi:RHS repeat-associated protein
VQETAGGVTTDFYYSDQWQVLEERVGGQARVQYVWSPVYVDALVLRDRNTDGDGTLDERLWVVQDANYNVTAIFDNSGNVVERYIYDPFGQATVLDAEWNVRSGGSAYDWLYLHQGGRYDVTSGLYHFRYRDYSPTLGRWTSLDPLRYDAGDVNLYRPVGNNPLNSLDPSGLEEVVPYYDVTLALVPAASNPGGLVDRLKGTLNTLQDALNNLKNLNKLTPQQWELVLDLAQLTLDIIGIVEPTPIADGLNMAISIWRWDISGAALSGLGMFPWFGDLAKAGKLKHYFNRMHELLRMAARDRQLLEMLEPVLRPVYSTLKQLPLERLPQMWQWLVEPIAKLRDEIGKVLNNSVKAIAKTPAQALAEQVKANGFNILRSAGRPGSNPNIRELAGTQSEARAFFDTITAGGKVIVNDPKLVIVKMGDGTILTFRPAAKYPNKVTGILPPTIDINIPGQPHLKLKMLPEDNQ